MRGQAFVIFKEVPSAVAAIKSMQGFPFYDKPMRIAFSRMDSDIIAKMKGTFTERPKKAPMESKKAKKRAAKAEAAKTTGQAKAPATPASSGSPAPTPPPPKASIGGAARAPIPQHADIEMPDSLEELRMELDEDGWPIVAGASEADLRAAGAKLRAWALGKRARSSTTSA